jgi:outer membrane protein OmpA-like peptidoglycan-associated protein
MAGLLMVFALTTVITLLDIGKRIIEPTKPLEEWEKIVGRIRSNEELKAIKNVKIDPYTGALVISEKNLRFGFGKTDLGDEAKEALRQAVPKYMAIIYQDTEFKKRIQRIEISGHTDRVDSGHANPWFSRERAGQVLLFLMDEPSMEPYLSFLNAKAVTAGFAATRFPKECKEDRCADARRVEITIKLDEAEVLRKFLNIIRQVIK